MRSLIRVLAELAYSAMPSRLHLEDRLILCYHNVVPDCTPIAGERSLHIYESAFRAQIECVLRSADVVSLTDLLTAPANYGPLVSITFDDAYASALLVGVRACIDYGVPSTVFVAPTLLGEVPTWDVQASIGRWDEKERDAFLWNTSRDLVASPPSVKLDDRLEAVRIATHAELRDCVDAARGLVRVGNHTWTHANLANLDEAGVHLELGTCNKWLRSHFSDSLEPFCAFPFGLQPSSLTSIVQNGLSGLNTDGAWFTLTRAHHMKALPRWNVPSGISLRGFAARIKGWLIPRHG